MASFDVNKYENAFQLGGQIQTANIASSAVTAAKIAASTITGAKSTLGVWVNTYVAQSAGTAVAVNVFPTSTAPAAGTITGLYVIANTATANTVSLFTTTGGTVAAIAAGTSNGGMTGTAVLTATVAAGDTVTISGSTNNPATAVVIFQTKS